MQLNCLDWVKRYKRTLYIRIKDKCSKICKWSPWSQYTYWYCLLIPLFCTNAYPPFINNIYPQGSTKAKLATSFDKSKIYEFCQIYKGLKWHFQPKYLLPTGREYTNCKFQNKMLMIYLSLIKLNKSLFNQRCKHYFYHCVGNIPSIWLW